VSSASDQDEEKHKRGAMKSPTRGKTEPSLLRRQDSSNKTQEGEQVGGEGVNKRELLGEG